MAIPVIPTVDPTVLPPEPERIFDHYWLKSILIQADDPTQPIRVVAILHKAMTVDGVTTLSPVDQDLVIVVPDLLTSAAIMAAATPAHTELLDAMSAVLTGLITYANFNNIVM